MDFTELLERLKMLDEITLLEALEISSEDLVERFTDKVEAKESELLKDFSEELEEENEDSIWMDR